MKWKKVDPGRFEGKSFELAPTTRVEAASPLADDFMFEILDFDAGGYLITDESTLADYADVDSFDTDLCWKLIEEKYGVTKDDTKSNKLVDIFDEIIVRSNPQ